jgi:hypothetical protein
LEVARLNERSLSEDEPHDGTRATRPGLPDDVGKTLRISERLSITAQAPDIVSTANLRVDYGAQEAVRDALRAQEFNCFDRDADTLDARTSGALRTFSKGLRWVDWA